jgi:hypothetical protein
MANVAESTLNNTLGKGPPLRLMLHSCNKPTAGRQFPRRRGRERVGCDQGGAEAQGVVVESGNPAGEQGRFTQAKHWYFHRRSRLVQADVLPNMR